MDRFRACLDGFTWRPTVDGQPLHNTPHDRGGPTAHGVILATWSAWRAAHGHPVTTQADLAAATDDELAEMIRAWFWTPVGAPGLPPGTDLSVFDFGFGSGTGRSARILQRVLGVAVDGVVGPKTQAAARAAGPDLIDKLGNAHLEYYQAIPDPGGWPTFGRGWANRNNARVAAAKKMASEDAARPLAMQSRRMA